MDINSEFPIKVFVFGTLRKGGRLDYYTDGSKYTGKYYTEGQLMKSEIGSAYIDFDQKGLATTGELYFMNFAGLLRIDHLESTSGEFPKGYDLHLTPVWKLTDDPISFNEENRSYAFVYKRRNKPQKIMSGDWTKRTKPVEEIKKYLDANNPEKINADSLIKHMIQYLKK